MPSSLLHPSTVQYGNQSPQDTRRTIPSAHHDTESNTSGLASLVSKYERLGRLSTRQNASPETKPPVANPHPQRLPQSSTTISLYSSPRLRRPVADSQSLREPTTPQTAKHSLWPITTSPKQQSAPKQAPRVEPNEGSASSVKPFIAQKRKLFEGSRPRSDIHKVQNTTSAPLVPAKNEESPEKLEKPHPPDTEGDVESCSSSSTCDSSQLDYKGNRYDRDAVNIGTCYRVLCTPTKPPSPASICLKDGPPVSSSLSSSSCETYVSNNNTDSHPSCRSEGSSAKSLSPTKTNPAVKRDEMPTTDRSSLVQEPTIVSAQVPTDLNHRYSLRHCSAVSHHGAPSQASPDHDTSTTPYQESLSVVAAQQLLKDAEIHFHEAPSCPVSDCKPAVFQTSTRGWSPKVNTCHQRPTIMTQSAEAKSSREGNEDFKAKVPSRLRETIGLFESLAYRSARQPTPPTNVRIRQKIRSRDSESDAMSATMDGSSTGRFRGSVRTISASWKRKFSGSSKMHEQNSSPKVQLRTASTQRKGSQQRQPLFRTWYPDSESVSHEYSPKKSQKLKKLKKRSPDPMLPRFDV